MPGAERPPWRRDAMAAAPVMALQSCITPETAATEPFVTLVRVTAHLLQVPIAVVTLIGGGHQWIEAAYGVDPQRSSRILDFCNQATVGPSGVGPSGAMVVPDTQADPRFQDHPLVLASPHVRAYAGVRLIDNGGTVLGALCAMDDKPSPAGPEALALLHKMAGEVVDGLARQGNVLLTSDRPNQRSRYGAWHSPAESHEFNGRPELGPSPVRTSGPGWLGVRTEHTPVPGNDREGRLLLAVAAHGPAARAGLQVGDVILAIDGRAARRRNDLTLAIASCALGGVMRLRIWRAGKVFERDVRLEPTPKEWLLRQHAL